MWTFYKSENKIGEPILETTELKKINCSNFTFY